MNEKELLEELNSILTQILSGRKVSYTKEGDPKYNSSLSELAKNIYILADSYNENYDFVMDIARGNLETSSPKGNMLSAPYKQLQSDLRHMVWQISQISQGDYSQRVSFSGDFSTSINRMIDSLKEKQRIDELNLKYLEELKDLNATKDRFFSIIAHDLKNPFSGLMGFSDLLVSDLEKGDYGSVLDYARILKSVSEQSYNLLVNLLEWSRSQRGAIKIERQPLSVKNLIAEHCSFFEGSANKKGIEIICEFKENDYILFSDSNMISTVLRNLISNAIKYTPSQGVIEIGAERGDGCIRFFVSDSGVGISQEDIEKLFRIDIHFSKHGTDNESGTGLGLIICKEFINRLSGEIGVNSELGKGSCFYFTIPL